MRFCTRHGRYQSFHVVLILYSHSHPLVSRNRPIYTFGPGLYAACDIGDGNVTLGAQILGYPQAAPAMMAMNEQVFVFGQSADLLGNLAHRDELRAVDVCRFIFEGLANVYEEDFARLFGEQAAGFLNGDLQRVCGR